MAVSRAFWDEVGDPRPPWCPVSWALYAIWPSPVDHDACLAGAGFDEFADGDEAWEADFAARVAGMVDALESWGPPRLLAGEEPRAPVGTRRGDGDAALAAALAAARDDGFPPCQVAFGTPPRALLRTSDGHPVLWVALADGGIEGVRDRFAAGLPVSRRSLDWGRLA